MVTLTIRDVPDHMRNVLVTEARERGQSLQAFLLSVLRRQAQFSHNRQLLREIDEDLARGGGAGHDAPDASDVLDEARAERGRAADRSSRRGSNDAA